MKKMIKAFVGKTAIKIALVIAISGLAFVLVSCGGGLSGTYYSTNGKFAAAQFNGEPIMSIEFKSFGEAEIVTEGFIRNTYKDASYKIDGNKITLKAEWNYTDKWEGSYSFRESGNRIYLDDREYSK